jgi:hypothetical protein
VAGVKIETDDEKLAGGVEVIRLRQGFHLGEASARLVGATINGETTLCRLGGITRLFEDFRDVAARDMGPGREIGRFNGIRREKARKPQKRSCVLDRIYPTESLMMGVPDRQFNGLRGALSKKASPKEIQINRDKNERRCRFHK